MESSCTARACLLGGDASLSALLVDVLAELGIALEPEACTPGAQPDVVLVHAERGEGILPRLQRARELTPQGPVLVLVPFADERLVQLALRLGAQDCFALGRPLDELRRMLLAHMPRTWGPRSTPSGGAVPPSSGDDP